MVYQVLENDLEEYYRIIMNKEYSDKLIIAYFCLVLISSLVNDYDLLSEKNWKGAFPTFLKTIVFLKYLIASS